MGNNSNKKILPKVNNSNIKNGCYRGITPLQNMVVNGSLIHSMVSMGNKIGGQRGITLSLRLNYIIMCQFIR